MSREINCGRCSKYLGEIRDAKLMKSIVHICDDCITKYKALEMARNVGGSGGDKNANNPFGDIFEDTFGEIFGDKKWSK